MQTKLAALGVGVALALAIAPSSAARAEEDLAPPLAADRDTIGRPGPPIVYVGREALGTGGGRRACSFRAPICVHYARTPHLAAAVLAAAERAWETLTGALALPAPDVDPETLAYDVFLAPDAPELAATHLAARDVRSRVDRARAFTVVDQRGREGCALDAAVTRAIARAILYRVSPATDEGIARGQTAYLAQLVVPCAPAFEADAAEAFQSHPERAVCDARAADEPPLPDVPPSRASALFADGSSLFWSRMDWAYWRASPGFSVRATWALSPSMTPLGAKDFRDEPDAFDVLRATFKAGAGRAGAPADLLLDSAIARAFFGVPGDDAHHPETGTLGEAARVPLEWDIPWPIEPRRLATRTPVAPTGSSYLVIRRAGAPAGSRLRAEITWEEHALFRWAFVKLDAGGHELGRVVVPTRERATEAQMTLVDLDGTDRVLLVGVNVGDPAYAFDPDEAVWEPHGWLVTIASE